MELQSTAVLKIGVLVYNHAPYLKQTLDSLLNQITNYKYEIWIFEDCSKDESREICIEYSKQYPEKIRLVLNEKNLGDFWNLRLNFKNLDSKYLALLDGDDYWTNENKIEEMITFLDKHPEFVATSHNVRLTFDNKPSELLHKQPFSRTTHTIEDLISGYCYHHTSALIYRNIFLGKLPEMYYHQNSGDWFMSMMFAEYGNIKYFPETWSVYRIHQGGFWSRLSERDQALLNFDSMFYYDQLFNFKYKELFGRNYSEIRRFIRQCPNKIRNLPILFKYAFLMLSYDVKANKLRMLHKPFKALYLMMGIFFKVKLR